MILMMEGVYDGGIMMIDRIIKEKLNERNVFKENPILFEAYLKLDDITSFINVPLKYRKQLAITIAQEKGCPDCLSYHICLGKMAGLSKEEIVMNIKGVSLDSKTAVRLKLVQELVRKKGALSEQIIKEFKLAGDHDNEDIMKTILFVVLNVLYMDNLCQSFCRTKSNDRAVV
ncbi:hypothetical protein UJ101_00592 [Flavobacteriaceae bacterium UJ101]|nr:hypothetical protein UJ101_00592 [Flavobacteriaceae bacterium UJ101]